MDGLRAEMPLDMNGDTTADLQDLVERLRDGDSSCAGHWWTAFTIALRRIAAAMLQKDFARLRGRHDLDSVVDESWVQLLKALETTQPATVEEFYRWSSAKSAMCCSTWPEATAGTTPTARSASDAEGSDSAVPSDLGDTTYDPARLAFWTEIHREIGRLPADQRIVFRFHYFADLPQAEVARLLDLQPKQVSRLWIAATARLAQRLDGIEELI